MSLSTITSYGYNKGYIRRINKEIRTFEENFTEVLHDIDTETKTHIVSVQIKNDIVSFRIPSMFPFKPPAIKYNQKNYRDMLIFRTLYFQNVLKDNGITCLCCDSYLCTSNWCPIITLQRCAEEVEKNRNLILAILRTRLIRQIISSMGITCPEIPDLILDFLIEGKKPIVREKTMIDD